MNDFSFRYFMFYNWKWWRKCEAEIKPGWLSLLYGWVHLKVYSLWLVDADVNFLSDIGWETMKWFVCFVCFISCRSPFGSRVVVTIHVCCPWELCASDWLKFPYSPSVIDYWLVHSLSKFFSVKSPIN